jgi:hyperosmotically inducible periplasmic protein
MKHLKYAVFILFIVCTGSALADKTTGQVIDDSVIQAEVKAKIMSEDFMTGGWDINLETRKGVVQLGGFIDDPEKAKKAVELAGTVEGVVKVDDQLHQKSGDRSVGQVTDDGITTTRVKTAIASADLGQGVKINVDTYNGTVLLTGFVDTVQDKERAEAIAAKDANTKKVINGIYVLN